MKKSMILVLITMLACKTENVVPTTAAPNVFDPTTATLLKTGVLMGIGHTVSGTAAIYDSNGTKVVLLEPFDSQNGPDLKVYLSKDVNATSYISLGNLKSISGKQSYNVPGTPNINEYTHVHIWCEQFSVVFGVAEVK